MSINSQLHIIHKMLSCDQDILERIFGFLFSVVQQNYETRYILTLVSVEFEQLVRDIIDAKIHTMMNSPLTLKVTVGGFPDDRSGDECDYLIGSFGILATPVVKPILFHFNRRGKDHYGRERAYEQRILENVHPGDELQCGWLHSHLHSAKKCVAFGLNSTPPVSEFQSESIWSPPVSDVYWLYVYEISTYFVSYVYQILPYYRSCNKALKIYHLNPGKEVFIEDLHRESTSQSNPYPLFF